MSLRDQYDAAAIQGLMYHAIEYGWSAEYLAEKACEFADAVLTRRSEETVAPGKEKTCCGGCNK